MKRIASIGVVVVAFAVAPTVAAAGNFAAEIKPQVSAQVSSAQVAKVQVAKVRRAQAAVSIQRHLVEIKLARLYAELRPLIG